MTRQNINETEMDRTKDEKYVADTLGFSNTFRARILLQKNGYDCEKAIRSWKESSSSVPDLPPMPPKPEKSQTTTAPQEFPAEDSSSEQSAAEAPTPYPDTPMTPVHDDTAEWDFTLPRIPAPGTLVNGDQDGVTDFCLDEIIGAIQGGESLE